MDASDAWAPPTAAAIQRKGRSGKNMGRACLPAVSEELERQGVEAAGAPGIWEGPSPRHEPSHSEAVRLPCFILMLTFGRTRPVVGTMPRFSGSHVGMRVARHSCYPDERVKPSPRDARVLRPLLCPVSDPSPDMSPQSQRVPNLGMKEATESPDAPLWPNPTSACAWESSWCTSQGPERVTKHGGRNHKGRDYLGPSHKARDGPLGAAGVFLSEHLRSAPAGPSSAPAPAAGPLVPPACSRHRPWAACFQLRRGQGRQRPETLPRSASPDLGAELSGSEAEEFLPALESS
ncbi:uncharacterized protein LOC103662638 isoform X2 [Ursus maritimus]|uniref:Uncharacterized protein LOC103662638 isoform X2 n=1 Tax=Ursus maritimus TaxID=29073 RepID=A0A384C252_URSMA|nr:uncharacterized protein LOC103662638 isoform X2 [Ursus maritimus]